MSPIHWFNVKADAIWWWMSYCKSPGDLHFLAVSCLQNNNWRWNWFFHIGQQSAEDLKRRCSPWVKARADPLRYSETGSTHASFPNMPNFLYPYKKYALIFSSGCFVPAEFGHLYHLPSLSGPVTFTLGLLHSNSKQELSLGDRNMYDASMKHGITKICRACVCKLC